MSKIRKNNAQDFQPPIKTLYKQLINIGRDNTILPISIWYAARGEKIIVTCVSAALYGTPIILLDRYCMPDASRYGLLQKKLSQQLI